MNSVAPPTITKPTTANRVADKSVPAPAVDKKVPAETGAGRGIGETIASVGGKAAAVGMDVAQKGVSAIADQAITGVEHRARHAVRATVLNPMATLYSSMNVFLPFGVGKNLFSAVVSNFFLPYYQQINPDTKITSEQIIHALEHGHTDSIENELFQAFDQFINSNLKDDEKAKYEAGDKLVVVKAFKNLAMSQINTAKEPGGIKKICNGIANFIPLVNKLPAVVKPWVGGGIGVFVAYKLARIALYMVKKLLWLVGGVLGIKFLVNKFGGGAGAHSGLPSMPAMASHGHAGGHGEEPVSPAGGGMMDKIMKGVSKAAELAAQAQGGAGGHGAPGGGGFAQALSALSGAGGGGGGH